MKARRQNRTDVVICDDLETIRAETEQMQARIRARAFEISQIRGHGGREVDDWLTAESELVSIPPMELSEKDDGYIVRLSIPSFDVETMTLLVDGHQALLKGDFRHDHEPGAAIHTCEFRSATIFRHFRFPFPIDCDSLTVKAENGLLRITARREGVAPKPARRRAVTRTPKKAAAKKKRAG